MEVISALTTSGFEGKVEEEQSVRSYNDFAVRLRGGDDDDDVEKIPSSPEQESHRWSASSLDETKNQLQVSQVNCRRIKQKSDDYIFNLKMIIVVLILVIAGIILEHGKYFVREEEATNQK